MGVESTRYVDGDQIRLWRPEGASHLRAEIIGERSIPVVLIRRSFPQSEPDRFLSIQGADGVEICILRNVTELDPASRTVVEEDLDRRYHTPRISAIRELKHDAGMWYFEADTQRGPCTFYVRNWRDSAHETGPGRLQILTVDGRRFEIEDYLALDERSLTLMEQLG